MTEVLLAAALVLPCTPTPALYANWKSTTPWPLAPDSVVQREVNSYRGRVKFDPFDAMIASDSGTRARLGERVLWKNDSVIVIVAKPSTPREALIVSK